MLLTQIGHENVAMPDLELIPIGAVRDAVIHIIAVREELTKASRAMLAADEAERIVREAEILRQGDMLAADPTAEIDDPTGEVDKAAKAARVARARVEALQRAGDLAVASLRATITGRRAAWAKKATSAASKALADLTTSIRLADEAREKLYASVGVLGMLRGFADSPSGAPIAIQHRAYGYTFAVDAGMESLREALKLASDELDAHKSALTTKRDDDVDAPVPSTPVASAPEAFAIVAEPDDEGDDDA